LQTGRAELRFGKKLVLNEVQQCFIIRTKGIAYVSQEKNSLVCGDLAHENKTMKK
jgi:hypothetical protein